MNFTLKTNRTLTGTKSRRSNNVNHSKIEQGVRLILQGLNCDTKNRNFAETPERVARAYAELFTAADTEFTTFEESYSDLILLRKHKIFTLCPHHLFLVEMDCSVAYIPNGEVLGLSKLARVLNECNFGPLMQEEFTRAVTDKLDKLSKGNRGVACVVTGTHDCMRVRGVKSSGNVTTLSLKGEFLTPHIQATFLSMVHAK